MALIKKLLHIQHTNIFNITQYHGFGWQIGSELSTNDATVTMRPGNLAPNAAVVAPILLHLGLVDVRQALSSVPCHLLFGVHSIDLNQGGAWVLVRLRPNQNNQSAQTLVSIQLTTEKQNQIFFNFKDLSVEKQLQPNNNKKHNTKSITFCIRERCPRRRV